MGTTIRIWQIDHQRAADLEGGMPEARRALIAEGTRELDLDQSWNELSTILEALGLESPFDRDELSLPEVKRIARTLAAMPWPQVQALCATLGTPIEDDEYVGPYYEQFRALVREAASAARAIAIEVL